MGATPVSDLLHLTLEERLELVEDLWEGIGSESDFRIAFAIDDRGSA